jgi:hypothetical protein
MGNEIKYDPLLYYIALSGLNINSFPSKKQVNFELVVRSYYKDLNLITLQYDSATWLYQNNSTQITISTHRT